MNLFLAFALLVTQPSAIPAATAPDPRALEALRDFGRCVVDPNPRRASALLAMDFRTDAYRKALHDYAVNRVRCLPNRSILRSQQTLIAGAMAEALLLNQTRGRLETALTRGPATPPIVSRSDSETTMLCAVMANPAATVRLISTRPASADERETLARLASAMTPCLADKQQMTVNRPGLRALAALAALRIASANGAVQEAAQ